MIGQSNFFFSTYSWTNCRTTYEESKSTLSEELSKFVPVPTHLMGYVIGKKGSTIKQILSQSGARVITQDRSKAQLGFMVYGSKEEIKRAVELINEKLQVSVDLHSTDLYRRTFFQTAGHFQGIFFNSFLHLIMYYSELHYQSQFVENICFCFNCCCCC